MSTSIIKVNIFFNRNISFQIFEKTILILSSQYIQIKYIPDPNSKTDQHPKWGGNAVGRYVRVDSSVNLQPVYQHEFFELYVYLYFG